MPHSSELQVFLNDFIVETASEVMNLPPECIAEYVRRATAKKEDLQLRVTQSQISEGQFRLKHISSLVLERKSQISASSAKITFLFSESKELFVLIKASGLQESVNLQLTTQELYRQFSEIKVILYRLKQSTLNDTSAKTKMPIREPQIQPISQPRKKKQRSIAKDERFEDGNFTDQRNCFFNQKFSEILRELAMSPIGSVSQQAQDKQLNCDRNSHILQVKLKEWPLNLSNLRGKNHKNPNSLLRRQGNIQDSTGE